MSNALVLLAVLIGASSCSSPAAPCGGVLHEDGTGRYCGYGVIAGGFACPSSFPVPIDIDIRFFDWPPSEEAFARVLTFSADPTRLTEAQESVFARIKERAVQLDAEAGEDAVSVSVAFCTGAVDP